MIYFSEYIFFIKMKLLIFQPPTTTHWHRCWDSRKRAVSPRPPSSPCLAGKSREDSTRIWPRLKNIDIFVDDYWLMSWVIPLALIYKDKLPPYVSVMKISFVHSFWYRFSLSLKNSTNLSEHMGLANRKCHKFMSSHIPCLEWISDLFSVWVSLSGHFILIWPQ